MRNCTVGLAMRTGFLKVGRWFVQGAREARSLTKLQWHGKPYHRTRREQGRLPCGRMLFWRGLYWYRPDIC